jgi:hypothetical protein
LSIIYDALKKAEKNVNTEPKAKTKPKPKLYLIYILAVCFGLFIASLVFSYLTSSKKQSLAGTKKISIAKKTNLGFPVKPSPPTPSNPKPAPSVKIVQASSGNIRKEHQGQFVLNGIFFSGNEGYALVNNNIVKENDTVEGATVRKITLDEVELDYEGKAVKLYNR